LLVKGDVRDGQTVHIDAEDLTGDLQFSAAAGHGAEGAA
jgi:hypothetical protein